MARYIVKRVSYALLTLFLVSTITFWLMYLVPGGPFLSEKAKSEATMAALEEKYGLDQPKIVQYKNYLVNLLHGDLGVSTKQRGRSVNDIIADGFPVSAKIGGTAILVAILIGIPLGSIAALNRGKWIDHLIIVLSTTGIAIPSFIVATLLMYVFSVQNNLLPTYWRGDFKSMILPVISLAFYPSAYIARLIRSSILDVLGQDYMTTARAKGLSQFVRLFKHALRNAILPVVTYLGPAIAGILAGSFVVEKILTIPGLGGAFISSITSRDYPLIMGTAVFFATLLIVLNVIVDIAYKIIDPRIKLN
ncbi:ABC transporter permease [Velocimicrobium porci]|uniref:ABC transporter permease n=1 Tax=Velocimicrobium porci TaxID=2606634 RepID=A0A6L5Y3B5_9FIRM|nr:ABC transporter permease [Velocimicrobium porci]MSS64633.1 ABC transporter permease [Velocimicrobium porci]